MHRSSAISPASNPVALSALLPAASVIPMQARAMNEIVAVYAPSSAFVKNGAFCSLSVKLDTVAVELADKILSGKPPVKHKHYPVTTNEDLVSMKGLPSGSV